MTTFVIDNSVVMSWYFEDESTPYTDAVLDCLADHECVVPSLWPLEVANVLLVGERRGRSTEARAARFITLLQGLPIRVDPFTASQALAETYQLAREHGLSSYDAAYLELAMRSGIALATQDKQLTAAARKSGVFLFLQDK
jgi:predicted nucleic acid-binding protein